MREPSTRPDEGAAPTRGAAQPVPLRWMLLIGAALSAIIFALAGPAGCRALRDPRMPYHEPLASVQKAPTPNR